MLAQQLLLPVLALVGAAAAGSKDSQPTLCSQPTATITAAGDAGYAACTSVSGSIVISPEVAGVVAINGPKEIKGDLIAENGNVTGITSSSIQSIGGTWTLTAVTQLQNLEFDELTSVQNIQWSATGGLTALNFPKTVTQASTVSIQDSQLNNLDGIDLNTVDVIDLENNRHLMEFTSQITNIATLTIASNGQQLAVMLPNLIWAGNATFRNASTVSVPSLQTVNGSLSLDGNLFSNFTANNLTSVGTNGGSFTLLGNKNIENIALPALKTIGGANFISNNTALTSIAFQALQTVSGAIFFSGNFSTPLLPALKSVRGGFSVESTADIDCTAFKAESGPANVIEGKFTCDTTSTPAPLGSTSTSSTSSPTSSSSAQPSKGKSAATSYGINEAVAGLSVIGGLFQMLL